MNLRETRVAFTNALAFLVEQINQSGDYTCAFGEVQRGPVQAAANALKAEGRLSLAAHLKSTADYPDMAAALELPAGNGVLLSVHRDGLACDLMLYKDGVWCQDAKDYEQFGVLWESLHPLARWGGRFKDPAHFSFEWNGRR